MVITIDSGASALIYELALIPAILDWIGLGQDFQATLWIGLDWVSKNGPMSNSATKYNKVLQNDSKKSKVKLFYSAPES